MPLGEVCSHGSLKRSCNICALESDLARITEERNADRKLIANLANWNDSLRVTIEDYLNERANKQDLKLAMTSWTNHNELKHWKHIAGKMADKLNEMKSMSYFDDAEGPELRAQNAQLHRLATEALALYSDSLKAGDGK